MIYQGGLHIMKLNNKFLLITTVVVALPLSVANAENGPALVQPEKPVYAEKGPVLENEAPGEFKGGVNGPVTVTEKPAYGEKTVAPAVQPALPEYKVPSTVKNTVQGKNVQKALPKTSAVK